MVRYVVVGNRSWTHAASAQHDPEGNEFDIN